jgi:hypothetical protein
MVEVMACLLRLLWTKSRAQTLSDLSEVQLFYPITDVTTATNLSSRDVVMADARTDEGDARHRPAASARQHEQPRGVLRQRGKYAEAKTLQRQTLQLKKAA